MAEYFRDIYRSITTTFYSMWIAGKHMFTPAVTLQYPTVRWELPERARSRLFNKIEDCIGCGQCARVCPTDCIDIQTEKRGKEEPKIFASDGTAIKLRTYVFDIDMTLCCYCGLCTFPCPTHCLVMTKEYEYSAYDKRDHVYHFAVDKRLLEAQSKDDPDPKEKPNPKEKPAPQA